MPKPCVLVFYGENSAEALKQTLDGLEEEGVAYVTRYGQGNAERLAYLAACENEGKVGIGISGSQSVLQIEGLPEKKPVCCETQNHGRTGRNAARIFKKTRLIR